MKKAVLFLLLAVAICGAQTHTFLDERSVANFNHNWGAVHMDTLHLKAGVDTLLLSGDRSGHNTVIQSLDGSVFLKLSSTWDHWWTIEDGSAFSFSGGERDTLFFKSGEIDSSVVQALWTSWN